MVGSFNTFCCVSTSSLLPSNCKATYGNSSTMHFSFIAKAAFQQVLCGSSDRTLIARSATAATAFGILWAHSIFLIYTVSSVRLVAENKS